MSKIVPTPVTTFHQDLVSSDWRPASEVETSIVRIKSIISSLKLNTHLYSRDGKFHPNVLILCLGATVIGMEGLYSGCNSILAIGFGGALLLQGLVAIAYVILVYSLAEVISTASFCGGAYGMTRVVLGFYPGFLVATFELMEYSMFASLAVQLNVEMLISHYNWDPSYQLWLTFLIYALCAVFLLERNYLWWGLITLLGVYDLTVLIIYLIGSAPSANFEENASLHLNIDNKAAMNNWFYGDMKTFLGVMPFCIWGFAGVEATSFMTDLVDEPRKNIPRALKCAVWMLVILVFPVIFMYSSLSPGVSSIFSHNHNENLALTIYPLGGGFSSMGMNADVTLGLTFIGTFGCSIFPLFPTSKLIEQMMASNLLPNLPYAKVNAPAIISLILSFLISVVSIQQPLFNIVYLALSFCLLTYLNALYAFIRLRMDYSCMERESVSPFGIVGAIYAWFVFALTWVGCVFYSQLPSLIYILIGMVGGFSVYYFCYVRGREKFSEAEQKGLLVFHIIKFNQKKRASIAHKRRQNFLLPFFNRVKPLPLQQLERDLANQPSVVCGDQRIRTDV